MLSNSVFGLFAGLVVYLYVVDNLGLASETGVIAGLIAGIVVSFAFMWYSLEYDQHSREVERWGRKRK